MIVVGLAWGLDYCLGPCGMMRGCGSPLHVLLKACRAASHSIISVPCNRFSESFPEGWMWVLCSAGVVISVLGTCKHSRRCAHSGCRDAEPSYQNQFGCDAHGLYDCQMCKAATCARLHMSRTEVARCRESIDRRPLHDSRKVPEFGISDTGKCAIQHARQPR